MSAALGLLRLQQVDSRIDQLEDKLGRIMAELENDAEASAARQALEAAEGELESAEAGRLAAESQTTSQRLKLRKAESSLYGGSVRNPKELQDLQADVASLKKHLASLEESELGWMEKLEAAEARSREARERLAQVSSRLEVSHAQLASQQGDLLHAREDLQAERIAAVGAVAGPFLEAYEGLRKSRRHIAVAEVGDNACGACGTVLTAALQQSARHAAELVYCPSCGRILYAG
jgi:hypothetical protein